MNTRNLLPFTGLIDEYDLVVVCDETPMLQWRMAAKAGLKSGGRHENVMS